MRSHKEQSRYPDGGGGDDELSTLPSPSSSVVDLASNAGTVETEVLLSSFKGARPPGSYTSFGFWYGGLHLVVAIPAQEYRI